MKLMKGSCRAHAAFGARVWGAALGVTALLVAVSQNAMAQSASTYEPSSRVRLRTEVCMKDEVDQGAMCVKRCDADFKLEENGKKLMCRATKSGAVRKTPQVEYQPPPAEPNAPPPKAGY